MAFGYMATYPERLVGPYSHDEVCAVHGRFLRRKAPAPYQLPLRERRVDCHLPQAPVVGHLRT
eukprot:1387443-Rhodomonas_salina.1